MALTKAGLLLVQQQSSRTLLQQDSYGSDNVGIIVGVTVVIVISVSTAAYLLWLLARRILKRRLSTVQWVPPSDLPVHLPATEVVRPPGLEDLTVDELLQQLPVVVLIKNETAAVTGCHGEGDDSIPAKHLREVELREVESTAE